MNVKTRVKVTIYKVCVSRKYRKTVDHRLICLVLPRALSHRSDSRMKKKNRDNDLSTYENRDNSNGNGIVAAFRKTKQEQKRFENVLNFGRDDRSLSDKQKNRFINSKTHVV